MKNILMLLSCCLPASVLAATFSLSIVDSAQQPLPYTVVELVHPDYPAVSLPDGAKVLQKDLNFQPFVSVVPQGTLVEFPNLDKTRHHVYSFSAAKTFELRLYAGKPEAPVLFDNAGVITLGCNIHDHMLAYIYVSASRYTTVTDAAGIATFTDLPPASFQLQLWHPWQKQTLPIDSISINDGENSKTIALDISQQALPVAPKKGFGDY
ncbi:MAG TPA: methylamine utilization protein [Rheinheimera sp.]|nr:methylamine utilization protein [Rheinheimera sp.]